MGRGRFQSDSPTGRRGFFRQLALSALETVERTGREMADRSLAGFRQAPPYVPPALPNDYYQHFSPQYTIYGPPWPPEYGPYLTMDLRRRLREAEDAQKQQRQGGAPVAQDESPAD